jgi:CubicO group peptidase (beta-lactamase class C family)
MTVMNLNADASPADARIRIERIDSRCRIDRQALEQAIAHAIEHRRPGRGTAMTPPGASISRTPRRGTAFGVRCTPRGPASGVILIGGQQLACWGEPERADLTFSVAKTYLAMLAGVAFDDGLLPDVDEPIAARIPGIGFDSGANRQVTWAQMLQQTSEWGGQCFGLPDQVDRYRILPYQRTVAQGAKGDAAVRFSSRAPSGNTTTCGSTSCRWRCCTCCVVRCRRSSANASRDRPALRRRMAVGRL